MKIGIKINSAFSENVSFFAPNPLKYSLIYHKLFSTYLPSEDILGNSLLNKQIIQFLLSYQYMFNDSITAAGHSPKFSMITLTFKNENSTGGSWNTILGYTANKSRLLTARISAK